VNGPDPTSAMLIAMLQEQMRHEWAANERRTQEALESERQREKTRRAESRNHAAKDCCCVAGGMFACILAAFVKIMADAARHGWNELYVVKRSWYDGHFVDTRKQKFSHLSSKYVYWRHISFSFFALRLHQQNIIEDSQSMKHAYAYLSYSV
jgi:hypothetical protein